MMILLEADPNDIFIIQVYMPRSRAVNDDVEEAHAEIEELLKLTKRKDYVFVIGD